MSGCVVLVTTPAFGGGNPLVEVWFAAEADPFEAALIVNQRSGAGSDTKVETVAKVQPSVLQALGIPQGTAKLVSLK
jgi:hypothetical protein